MTSCESHSEHHKPEVAIAGSRDGSQHNFERPQLTRAKSVSGQNQSLIKAQNASPHFSHPEQRDEYNPCVQRLESLRHIILAWAIG
jgi:hypothetical protein